MTTAPQQRAGTAPEQRTGTDRRWVLFSAFVPILVLLDQITKHLAETHLSARIAGVVPVIDGFFMLRYSRNRGAFFSLGEGLPDGFRVLFFAMAALLALALIVWVYRSAHASQRVLLWGLLLLCAGATGNLIDRLLNGEVIDFLHLHYADHFHWATFNVADIYITFGLLLLVWDAFRVPDLGRAADTSKTIGTT